MTIWCLVMEECLLVWYVASLFNNNIFIWSSFVGLRCFLVHLLLSWVFYSYVWFFDHFGHENHLTLCKSFCETSDCSSLLVLVLFLYSIMVLEGMQCNTCAKYERSLLEWNSGFPSILALNLVPHACVCCLGGTN